MSDIESETTAALEMQLREMASQWNAYEGMAEMAREAAAGYTAKRDAVGAKMREIADEIRRRKQEEGK